MYASDLRKESNSWIRAQVIDRDIATVLNVGCGSNIDFEGRKYSSYFNADRIINLDPNLQSGVDIIAEAEAIPLPNECIDLVFMNWVIGSTKTNAVKALEEITRVLVPSGFIMISFLLPTLKAKHLCDTLNMWYECRNMFRKVCQAPGDPYTGTAIVFYGTKF